jgi:C4-dicarboxylate-specific signal transduction histidine kinase
MSGTEWDRKWEEAYFRQSSDAAMGRLFRGMLHNLNGIVQAFSMQSELFGMLFPRMTEMLAGAQAVAEPGKGREQIEELRTLLNGRGILIEQMREKVQAAQHLLRRTQLLNEAAEGSPAYTVESVVRAEVEFLLADSFFKHRVEKELRLAPGLPALRQSGVELHQLLFALLVNAVEALRDGVAAPRILIEAQPRDGLLSMAVEDNGPGIQTNDLPRIFEPFFTTKSGHDGLGLCPIKKIMADWGGEILIASTPGRTRFTLEIPRERL